MNLLKRTGGAIASLVKASWNAFDVRDVFVFGGFPVLGYGLFLEYGLGKSLIVCGGCGLVLGCALTFSGKDK